MFFSVSPSTDDAQQATIDHHRTLLSETRGEVTLDLVVLCFLAYLLTYTTYLSCLSMDLYL